MSSDKRLTPRQLIARYFSRDHPAPWPEDPEEREDLNALVRAINVYRGPRTQEEADEQVRCGLLTPETARILLDMNRRQSPERQKRMNALVKAYRLRGRQGRHDIENDPGLQQYMRDKVADAEMLKTANPRMTWAQIAAHLFIAEKSLYTYRAWVRDHSEP